jgi:serine protease AprX
LAQTVIGRPLIDKLEASEDPNAVYDVIIDPNLDFSGGRGQACERIRSLIEAARAASDPDSRVRFDTAHPYVFASLSGRAIREITRKDSQAAAPATSGAGNSALTDGFGHGTRVAGIVVGTMDEAQAPRAIICTRDDNGAISSVLRPLGRALRGMAPQSKLISMKVPEEKLNDFGRRIVVHGVNRSLGYPFMHEWFACGQSPLGVEVNRLVKSYVSSKDPTGDGRMKSDLVEPAAGSTKDDASEGLPAEDKSKPFQYVEARTSMAAPHVSGVIAAFLSIRREFIGQPEDLKKLFLDNATDLNRERTFPGHGLVDLMRAIQAV